VSAPARADTKSERLAWLFAVASIAAATVFLFAPMAWGVLSGAPTFFEWDVPEQYWPDLVYLCDSLHDGVVPFWNPYDRAGYPYYADPQAGMYHPLNWGICLAAGPSPSPAWAHARVPLMFFLSGVFTLLWLRRLNLAWSGAILGAVVVMAAPFMRHNWELNLTMALAWMPLMLWAAERVIVLRRISDGALLAFATALCAWIGSPPALWFASSFTLLYALARLASEHRIHGPKIWHGVLRACACAGVLGVGLIGVVLIPGLTLAEHSVQQGRSFESIASGAIEPSGLVAMLWPQPGNHLYVGWAVLLLAAFALVLSRKERLVACAMWLVVLCAALLTLGGEGPLFRAAFEWVPGVSLFRLPHRYEAWFGPAFAFLAALGLQRMSRRSVPKHTLSLAISAGVVGTALAVANLWTPAFFFVSLACIALAAKRAQLRSPLVGLALASLFLADVSQAMPADRHMRGGDHPGIGEPVQRVLDEAPDTDAHYRYMDEFGISCRSGTRHRRRDFRGYQDPLLLKSYERVIAALRETPELAAQFNVRYALQGPHFIHGWDRHYLPPPDELNALPFVRAKREGVSEFHHALPLVYFVPNGFVTHAVDRPAALGMVREFAPRRLAILDGAVDPAGAPPFEGDDDMRSWINDAEQLRFDRDALSFHVEAAAEGMLVINEAWYPGWVATVDGQRVPIYRANALVRAIPISEGSHDVLMQFRPADGILWRGILYWSFMLMLLALRWPWLSRQFRKRRRKRRAPTQEDLGTK
jgi:hypothetical protein